MQARFGTWLATALLVVGSVAASGCRGDDDSSSGGGSQSATSESGSETPAEGERGSKPADEEKGASATSGAEPEPAADDAGGGSGEPPDGASEERKRLERAYVEIYCAQRAGKSDELLALYEEYGFDDPKAWTEAWTEAAKDEEWVARVTQKAAEECR